MPMELGEAVHRLLEQRGRRMLGAVGLPILGGILQSEVRREVEDLEPRRNQLGQQRRADPLGHTRHHDFGASDDKVGAQFFERGQIDPCKMAVDFAYLAPGVVLGGEDAQFDERMPGQDAHGLDARIA